MPLMDRRATEAVLEEVFDERERQHEKWGEQNHPDGTGTDPEGDAEMAEFAKQVCKQAAADGTVTYRHIAEEEFLEAFAESDPAKLRAELVQVAAVVVQWIETIDRRASKRRTT